MTLFDERQIEVIDSRIAKAQQSLTAWGTVASKDTTGPGVAVLFAGDSQPMPVKCPASVFCRPGDAVTLTKHGKTWVIQSAFVGPGLGEAFSKVTYGAANTAHNSTSFGDLSGFTAFSFTKVYDATVLWVTQMWQGYPSATVTGAEYGVRLAQVSGSTSYTSTDVAVGRAFINTAGIHGGSTGVERIFNVPAGVYTVSYRIRRFVGTGTLTSDQNDQVYIRMDERVRGDAPAL